MVVERPGLSRRQRSLEPGPPSARQIRRQRELGNGEHAPFDIRESEVHLALGVLEDAEPCDLARGLFRFKRAVPFLGSHEDEKATADPADRFPGHTDPRARHALDDELHARRRSATARSSDGSGAPARAAAAQ